MEKIQKAVRSAFILAMLFTALFPIGGVMLGVGLAAGLPPVWAIGIACLVGGFYGCPIAWVGYSGKRGLYRVAYAIHRENLYTVREISAQLGETEQDIRARLDTLFQKGWMLGYIRTPDGVALNENTPLEKRTTQKICPACGAKVSFTGRETACPYCGTRIEREE